MTIERNLKCTHWGAEGQTQDGGGDYRDEFNSIYKWGSICAGILIDVAVQLGVFAFFAIRVTICGDGSANDTARTQRSRCWRPETQIGGDNVGRSGTEEPAAQQRERSG
jgi:hypothetical protein